MDNDSTPYINTSPLSYCSLDHAPRHNGWAKHDFDEIRARYAGDEVYDDEVEQVARRCAAIRILNASSRHDQQRSTQHE